MTQAIIPVPAPDPKAMYLRFLVGTVESGRHEGSTFGFIGGALYVDVTYDGERQGIVVIPAGVWVAAILDAVAS